MPIARGAKGQPGVLGIPGKRFGAARFGTSHPFRSQAFSTSSLWLTGTTRDAGAAPLGNCIVHLFTTQDDRLIKEDVSDVNGNFTFQILVGGPFYIVAFNAGPPVLSGASSYILQGV
jgi:hypothetical protein